ncbi:hypothetical protein QM467_12365 [Rhodoblastus sp. 17X3]|uniref:hypothetical protein n=1 Tax=Rhodoblastus sp. 17X3 TaxID=3047026 RepID=UPI0024B64C9B|nr:hypothetical protein [Rhodoblastus sp. 17X3]MDI9848852.1 hypothetical protein [Rhodoblastus sp. 17X3]
MIEVELDDAGPPRVLTFQLCEINASFQSDRRIAGAAASRNHTHDQIFRDIRFDEGQHGRGRTPQTQVYPADFLRRIGPVNAFSCSRSKQRLVILRPDFVANVNDEGPSLEGPGKFDDIIRLGTPFGRRRHNHDIIATLLERWLRRRSFE